MGKPIVLFQFYSLIKTGYTTSCWHYQVIWREVFPSFFTLCLIVISVSSSINPMCACALETLCNINEILWFSLAVDILASN